MLPIVAHALCVILRTSLWQPVLAVFVPFAGRCIQSNLHIRCAVACLFNCLQHTRNSILIRSQIRCKASLIPNGGGKTSPLQHTSQSVVDLRTHLQSLPEGGCTPGHYHDLLDIHIVGSMGTAVQNVHHRHRQHIGIYASHIPVQRHVVMSCRRPGCCPGHCQHGICPQGGFIGCTVQSAHAPVDPVLIQSTLGNQRRRQHMVYIGYCLANAFPIVAAFLIPQLHCLKHAGGCTAGHTGGTQGTVRQQHLCPDCGIPPGVQHLISSDPFDFHTHACATPVVYGA